MPCVLEADLFSVEGTISADDVSILADVDGAVITVTVTVTDNYVWSMDTTNDLDVASEVELVQQASRNAPVILIPGQSTG